MSGNVPKSGTDWLKAQAAKAHNSLPMAPVCDPTEARDSEVERWLRDYGVKFAPKTLIPLTMVDEKGSLGNQARQEPLVPDSVDRFTAALKAGEYLPPIVVFPFGNKVRIVDGNNRYASHKKAGAQFIPGYVISPDTPSELIERLTVNANAHHGVTPPLSWRVRQAAYLMSLGFSQDQASSDAGVTKTQLQQHLMVLKADARAKSLKINGFADLPASTKVVLGPIHSDPVFYQTARTVIDTGMLRDEVKEFARAVKAIKDEASAIAYIGQVAQERKLEEQGRKARPAGRVRSPKQQLVTGLGMLAGVDPAEVARAVLTDLERVELVRRCYAASEKLLELTTALEAKEASADAG